jgi:hypothetical protein
MRPAQRTFVETLLEQRDVPPDFASQSLLDKFKEDKITRSEASVLIDALKALPRVYRGGRAAGRTADLPDVPEGRYCIFGGSGSAAQFYRVRRGSGQYEGWTYLDIQASDDFYPITNISRARRILEEINNDPMAAAVRYSHLLGKCFCCGRILTNKVSRKIGCGPICARKTGWFSQHVIAQLEAAGE